MRFGVFSTWMLSAVVSLTFAAAAARAAPVSGAAGYTYYQGAANNLTRAVTVEGTVQAPGSEYSLAVLRFDDGLIGSGVQVIGGLGVSLGSATTLRALGGPVVGDGDYRGWRAKLGPEFSLSRVAAVQASYLHYQDNQDFRSDGLALESAATLGPQLTGRLGASFASSSLDIQSTQATSGLTWVALPHVELSGEVGVARNGGVAPVGSPVPHSLLPPLLGPPPGPSQPAEDELSTIYQLGVRFTFP